MPYIITTTIREQEPERNGLIRGRLAANRRAVATLEEACNAAQELIDNAPPITSKLEWQQFCEWVAWLSESGGTIGPLPDGTVIEIWQTDTMALAGEMGWSSHQALEATDAKIIDAYNAYNAQAIV